MATAEDRDPSAGRTDAPRGGARVGHVWRGIGWVLVVVGVVAATVGAFLPWVHSGTRERNSFGVVRAARRLDVVDSELGRVALAAWYFVPLLAALVVLLVAVRRERAAASLAVLLGLVVLVVGLVVRTSPTDQGVGPAIACVAGAVAVVGGAISILTIRRDRSGGRT